MDLVKPRYIGETLHLFGDNPEATCESRESVEIIRGALTKLCTRCKQFKPRTKFPPQKNNGDGLHAHCHACHAERARAGYKVHHNFLREAKSGPCVDCGRRFPHQMMDFDHRPGTNKKFEIGIASTRSRSSILKEIEKCDLVCNHCHRVRTWNRRHPNDPIENPIIKEDMIRASQQCEEAGRNDQPWMN